MRNIFKSKKEEDIFNPPPEMYYEFYQELRSDLGCYNDGILISEEDYDPAFKFAIVSYDDFSYEVVCNQLQELPVVYCPNLYCLVEKTTTYLDDDGDEVTDSQTCWLIEMHICVVGNEIRCYILQRRYNDDDDFAERMAYQLNLEFKQTVWYNDNNKCLYVPKNQELFVLDYWDNCINKRDDGSYFVYISSEIVKKLKTLGCRILRFCEKEGDFG